MTNEGYNGWKNYETWAVALWLDNERGTHDQWIEMAQAALKACANDTSATINLADALKSEHAEMQDAFEDDKPACVFNDLLNAAMSEVDWYEIASHFIADAKEQIATA